MDNAFRDYPYNSSIRKAPRGYSVLRKLEDEDVAYIKREIDRDWSRANKERLAARFKISIGYLRQIKNGDVYADIEPAEED
jgi:hypothetical protein